MKDVIDWAKIWVAHLPCQQDFPLEPLAQGRIAGNLGKNCFEGDVYALQEAVFGLIDFAHPPFCDETKNDEAVDQHLTRRESPGRRQRRRSFVVADCYGGAPHVRRTLPAKKIKRGM